LTLFEKKCWQLRTMIDSSDNIVFFGGAGVSTESGIPDFRGEDGLYNKKYKYPPEEILSLRFFAANFREFYDFYRDKMLCLGAQPNAAHLELARLERIGKLKAVITQNIDGLHYKAGSKKVFEIHGSIHRNYCYRCHKCYSAEFVRDFDGTPQCPECGGLIKPDVVLYGENLKPDVTGGAIEAIKNADMLIVGGTSLTVYPAASFIDYYRGDKLVLINKTATEFDENVDLLIHGSIGAALTFHISPASMIPPAKPAETPCAANNTEEKAPEKKPRKPRKKAEKKPTAGENAVENTVENVSAAPEITDNPATPDNPETSDEKPEKKPRKRKKPKNKEEEENVPA
jgi:NAD-dependent deacetylase